MGCNTIKTLPMAPKDKDNITQKSRVIYRYKSDRLEYDKEYIGESVRTFRERFKEHLRAPSPIHVHANTSGHHAKLNSFSIVGKESHTTTGPIKEVVLIRVNDPSLNRIIGKFQLPHIWDEVILHTPDLHLI